MKITCPSCASELLVTIVSAAEPAKRAKVNPDITPITDVALRDVYDVIAAIGPFRKTSAELYAAYLKHCHEVGRRRPLSKNAFGRTLGQYGAERWRTTTSRGYELFEVPLIPLGMTPEARDRFIAAHQRQAVQDHVGGGGQGSTEPDVVDEVQQRLDAGLPPF